jgi:hypothetical protein
MKASAHVCLPRASSVPSSACQTRSHTPLASHSLKRRQQVIGLP